MITSRDFAIQAHSNQMYGDKPYSVHLENVVEVLQRFKMLDEYPELEAAGWLHDTIEDCHINFTDIRKEFGTDIAEIVYCVTDELGRSRRERHMKTYPKTAGNKRAVILKFADRIANVEYSITTKNFKKFQMYYKEFPIFSGFFKDFEIIYTMHQHLKELLETQMKEI